MRSGRVGSGRAGSGRVGPGRAGSGRVRSGQVDSGRELNRAPSRPSRALRQSRRLPSHDPPLSYWQVGGCDAADDKHAQPSMVYASVRVRVRACVRACTCLCVCACVSIPDDEHAQALIDQSIRREGEMSGGLGGGADCHAGVV